MANVNDGILQFFGKKNNTEDDRSTRKRLPKKFYYKTDNENIGYAIIFNHFEFAFEIDGKPVQRRNGTIEDEERMKNVLNDYGFNVEVFRDKTYVEIKEALERYSKRIIHSKSDCFVLVVMSHGDTNSVFSKDKTYLIEELWTPFLGKNCIELIDKPKIFFIQCCRGSKEETVVWQKDSKQNNLINYNTKPKNYSIPNTADLLLYYATFEGYFAWRDPKKGTCFIQTLCEVLENSNEPIELYDILTTVNFEVAHSNDYYEERIKNLCVQMPNFVSSLTKIFVLKRKKKKP